MGSEAVNFKFEETPELKDNQNRSYTLYATSMPESSKLQPSVAKEVSYIFEIPKDASGLSFIIKDKNRCYFNIVGHINPDISFCSKISDPELEQECFSNAAGKLLIK